MNACKMPSTTFRGRGESSLQIHPMCNSYNGGVFDLGNIKTSLNMESKANINTLPQVWKEEVFPSQTTTFSPVTLYC